MEEINHTKIPVREYPGYPEKYNPNRGEWEPIHKELKAPPNSSPGYPGWLCKSCSNQYPENTKLKKCNKVRGDSVCRGPLIRYKAYEQK